MDSPSAQNSAAVLRDDAAVAAGVRTQLEQVLASPSLRDAELLKRFLRYVVEKTLAGEGDQLKEYRLGVEVFDRDASFDPRLDPVVRMAARRLRAKLQEYYETEGRSDAIRIEVPKGAYVASFVSVPEATAADASASPSNGSR